MKKGIRLIAIGLTALMLGGCSASQINMERAASGISKAAQAMTLTDAQMASLVSQSVAQMDKENTIAGPNDPYTVRLNKLTQGITSVDGIPLNFKVYKTTDVNAFACPDGSVRVFTGIMDMMDDDELMGIIGHEIGHVQKHHSKNAFKQALLNSALMDAIASTSNVAAALTDSQLSALGSALAEAKFSRKQESEADDCGYDFLRAHGRNPWGMVMAFEKMKQMEGSAGSQAGYLQKMFSSHPDTKARIAAMTKRCQKDGIQRPSASKSTSTKAVKSAKAATSSKSAKSSKSSKSTKSAKKARR